MIVTKLDFSGDNNLASKPKCEANQFLNFLSVLSRFPFSYNPQICEFIAFVSWKLLYFQVHLFTSLPSIIHCLDCNKKMSLELYLKTSIHSSLSFLSKLRG